MITAKEALQLIIDNTNLTNTEMCSLENLVGKTLAHHFKARLDQPPFHRVSMDGIALNYEATLSLKNFKIEGIAKAGHETLSLDNLSQCLEIMTGAPLPKNTDTVIPYEEIKIENGNAFINPFYQVKKWSNIHDRGSDYQQNDILFYKGTNITAAHIAIFASNGITQIEVEKSPEIAIISTGDELINPGETLLPHQIYRSNTFALKALLEANLFHVKTMAHLPDDFNILKEKIEEIMKHHQIIILSGGVSKGKFDFVPKVLEECRVKTIFHKVNQRPGKPLLFGKGENGQLIFGLPGNPVSSFVNLRKYIVQLLKNKKQEPDFHVILKEDIEIKKDMTFFTPARLQFTNEGNVIANEIKSNGSGDFFALRDSDGFIELDNQDNINTFKKGDVYPFYLWKSI